MDDALTVTCGQCGKPSPSGQLQCYHCHYLYEPEKWDGEHAAGKESGRADNPFARDLAAPPRSVPAVLPMAYAVHGKLGLWALSLSAGIAAALLHVFVELHLGAAIVPAIVLVVSVTGSRYRRAAQVLRVGVAGTAKLLGKKHVGRLKATHAACATGWSVRPTHYDGSAYRETVQLGEPGGPTATFKQGWGFRPPYEGGLFVYDPQRPQRHVFVADFPLVEDMFGTWSAIRPGEDGALVATPSATVSASVGLLGATFLFAIPMLLVALLG